MKVVDESQLSILAQNIQINFVKIQKLILEFQLIIYLICYVRLFWREKM